jgi:hypothetical protein
MRPLLWKSNDSTSRDMLGSLEAFLKCAHIIYSSSGREISTGLRNDEKAALGNEISQR